MRSHHNSLILLNQFPEHRLFQFFVDGKMHRQEQGEAGFETREPGCMVAFYDAFDYALKNIDKKFDSELILTFHRLGTQNVTGDFGILTPGEFRNNAMKPFAIHYERFTKKGIESFMAAAEKNEMGLLAGETKNGSLVRFTAKDERVQRLLDDNAISPFLHFIPPFADQKSVLAQANMFMQELVDNLSIAQKQNDKDAIIKAIVHYVRSMELLHPFSDGNGRTFVNLALNYLLIQNDLLPVTLYEPNIFDLYSDDELVDAIKDAMSYTLFTIKHPDAALFGYKASEKNDVATDRIKNTIASYSDNINQNDILTSPYFLELELYLDTAWNKKYNLHRFAATGELDKIKQLSKDELNSNCNLLAPDSIAPLYKGLAPLHIACKMNNPEVASYLLDVNKEMVNQKDNFGNTPIYYAIQAGNAALIMKLIENGAILDSCNNNQESPLNWAEKYSVPLIYEKLLSKATSQSFVDLSDKEKLEVITRAAKENNLSLLKWIIDNQKINIKSLMENLGYTFGSYSDPLLSSLKKKSFDAFLFLLGKAFPDKNMPFSTFEMYIPTSVEKNNSKLFHAILDHTDLSTKSEPIDFDILESAFINHHYDLEILSQLINLEPKILELTNYEGFPLVSLAAAYGLKNILIKLIEAGADPNFKVDGETPLSLAARNNRLEIIRYLIEDAQVNPDNPPEKSKVMNKNNSIANLFFASNKIEQVSALASAVSSGHLEAVKLLLDLGATINEQAKEALANCKDNKNEIELLLTSHTKKFE